MGYANRRGTEPKAGSLVFNCADDYGRQMYIEVCEEYIKDLNRELASSKEIIRKEMG